MRFIKLLLKKVARFFYRRKILPGGEEEVRILFFSFKTVSAETTMLNGNGESIPLPVLQELIKPLYTESKEDFVHLSDDSYKRQDGDPKLLAYYLPQFHTIPLNDEHFGRGFTEWVNVTKAKPQFFGHHQPQLPIDVGFYDLSHDDVMYRQIELAKQYGLYGFCFYYYWFGKERRLLEKPLFNWLNNKELDFPFCLCWANENWSKLWDGGNNNVIMEQRAEKDSFNDFLDDIFPFFSDSRYIKVNGAPLLLIYRPMMFTNESFTYFVDNLQKAIQKKGMPRIHLLVTNAGASSDAPPLSCKDWHVDGIAEFPPHGLLRRPDIRVPHAFLQKNKLIVSDIEKYLETKEYLLAKKPEGGKLYKGCFPSWDNTSRKTFSYGFVFKGATPERYYNWLKDLIKYSKDNLPQEEQFVFINAWNEWAEGAHLEPDARYGYAYLDATRRAVEHSR